MIDKYHPSDRRVTKMHLEKMLRALGIFDGPNLAFTFNGITSYPFDRERYLLEELVQWGYMSKQIHCTSIGLENEEKNPMLYFSVTNLGADMLRIPICDLPEPEDQRQRAKRLEVGFYNKKKLVSYLTRLLN